MYGPTAKTCSPRIFISWYHLLNIAYSYEFCLRAAGADVHNNYWRCVDAAQVITVGDVNHAPIIVYNLIILLNVFYSLRGVYQSELCLLEIVNECVGFNVPLDT